MPKASNKAIGTVRFIGGALHPAMVIRLLVLRRSWEVGGKSVKLDLALGWFSSSSSSK